MGKLADKLTSYILKQNIIKEEDYAIYKYGMLTGLEMILCLAICFGIAIYIKSFLEFIILVTIFFSLRAYVGGIHTRHYISCLICSCTVIISLLIVSKVLVPPCCVSWIITGTTLLVINALAPASVGEKLSEKKESIFFEKQRKNILVSIAVMDTIFMVLTFSRYLALIMFAMSAILISVVLGLLKNAWLKRVGE